MKYFNELTPEQQTKALQKASPNTGLPLFKNDNAGLRILFSTKAYIFDDRLNAFPTAGEP
jgi:hypothetical protein